MTAGSPPEKLTWASPEIAWPLAILAGFLGTYLGVLASFPFAATVFAVVAFAPIFLRLQSYRKAGVAFLAAMAWLVGILGALVGVAVEEGPPAVYIALPFSEVFANAEWSVPAASEGALRVGSLVRNALVFGGMLLLARPLGGILSLGIAGVAAGYLGAGMALYAVRMATAGWSPSHAGIVGCPPHLVLPLFCGLAVVAAVAAPGRLLPLAHATPMRRSLFRWGLVGGGLFLVLEPLLAPLWRGSLS